MQPITVDFETKPIQDRPKYPPEPVGVSIKFPGKKAKYHAWGHPEKNNCSKDHAERILKLVWKERNPLLFHNAKFDLAVGEKHFALPKLPWDRVHDTMFTLFLKNPHASSLSLKPCAEEYLGQPPEERDAVQDWLFDHGVVTKQTKRVGDHIWQAPGDIVGRYANGDTQRTEDLHKLLLPDVYKLGMREAYDRERRLMPILMENEEKGMRVDVEALERDLHAYEKALLKVDKWLRKKLQSPGLNLDSDEDTAKALRHSGIVKDFPKTPTGRDSLSKKALTIDFFADKDAWAGLAYRNSLNNVLTQSMRPWLRVALESGGFLFTEWNQVRQTHEERVKGARSGRITCSRIQNITKSFFDKGDAYTREVDAKIRKLVGLPELPLVRKYLVPDVGDLWGHRDYNQQELRLVAHYEEGALSAQYKRDPATDIHSFVQALMKEATGILYERRYVKLINFRTVYGGGIAGLAVMLGIPYHDAAKMIGAWKLALPDVVSLDKELKGLFYDGKHLRTFGGRVYSCKPPTVAKKGPRKGQLVTYEYTALNYLIQPSGADVTKQATINYHEHPKRRGRMLNTVHDEINFSAPAKLAKKENEVLRECMEAIKLDVPWKTDGDERTAWGVAAA